MFKYGFTGASLDAVSEWAQYAVDGERVCLPFTGSGKDIAALAAGGRIITSWDTQYLSRCIVEGVFANQDPGPPMENGRAWGFTYEHRPIKQMPEDAAALADWLAGGSLLDQAALGKALIRCSYMGRLGAWARGLTATDLYGRYRMAHVELSRWTRLPGTFNHYHRDVFGDPRYRLAATDATVYIDPPKVLPTVKKGRDIYSRGGFVALNSILSQSQAELPVMTAEGYERQIPRLWEPSWRRLIMFHCTGAMPDLPGLEAMMTKAGLGPWEAVTWEHRTRSDVAYVLDREVSRGDPQDVHV